VRPNEHVALTGHIDFTWFTIEELKAIGREQLGREPRGDDRVPDVMGTCDVCGMPVTYTPLVSDDRHFKDPTDWINAVEAEYYVDQVELIANGEDGELAVLNIKGDRPDAE
jgi:hypothetical protein